MKDICHTSACCIYTYEVTAISINISWLPDNDLLNTTGKRDHNFPVYMNDFRSERINIALKSLLPPRRGTLRCEMKYSRAGLLGFFCIVLSMRLTESCILLSSGAKPLATIKICQKDLMYRHYGRCSFRSQNILHISFRCLFLSETSHPQTCLLTLS